MLAMPEFLRLAASIGRESRRVAKISVPPPEPERWQ